jgi:HSP20 family protein
MGKPGDPTCLFLRAADFFRDAVWRPAADVYCTETGWLVKLDLAGVNLDEISIETSGSRLCVRGVRRDSLLQQGCRYHSLEIAYSEFERGVDFPVDLEGARISTEYHAGMLLVRINLEKP